MIWRPDTCLCVLEYSAGANTAETFLRAVRVCRAHQGVADVHAEVVADNQKKNLALAALVAEVPELGVPVLDRRGAPILSVEGEVQYVPGPEVGWSYEGRRLVITLPAGTVKPRALDSFSDVEVR